ncbi:hypothetical protein [Ensifer aridi]|uniref:hypothetical protein n=1 Tax=Ensifer aridi TaxID=1708715 RepID=UPI001556FD7C|nr:hypothetical protein [Ensifer aridi]
MQEFKVVGGLDLAWQQTPSTSKTVTGTIRSRARVGAGRDHREGESPSGSSLLAGPLAG